MSLHRTQVLLKDWQYARLKEEAEAQGVSLSEMVRRFVAAGLAKSRGDAGLMAICGIGQGAGGPLKELDEELYEGEL